MVNKFIDFINKAYDGQDYSSAMGAGSLGLQKRERAAEKLPEEEKEDFKHYSNRAIFTGGIGIPAMIGAHEYTFGPMYTKAISAGAGEQAAQGGMAGNLILGDIAGSTIGLVSLPRLLERWEDEAHKRQTKKKYFGGELTSNKPTLISKYK